MITGGELLFGGRASNELRAFATTFCQSIEVGQEGSANDMEIGRVQLEANQDLPAQWQELIAKSQLQVFADRSTIAAQKLEE